MLCYIILYHIMASLLYVTTALSYFMSTTNKQIIIAPSLSPSPTGAMKATLQRIPNLTSSSAYMK